MDSIASMAMSMKAAQFQVQYSTAVTKKVMDTAELAGQEMVRMLEELPKGQYIDPYA